MRKESFILYASFYKPISKLSDKQLGRLFRAIFRYHIDGAVTVEEDIEMAFAFFVNQFEIDESKYQSKVERNRDNGRKGGAPKGNRNAAKKSTDTTENNPMVEKSTDTTETNVYNPKQAKQPITTLNDNDNVNDNELSLDNGARVRVREFLDDFFRDTIKIEAFCMNNHVSPERFRQISEEVVVEWQLAGQTHTDLTDARNHLINQTRKKIYAKPYETDKTDRLSERRGTDPGTKSRKDFKKSF